MWGRFWSRIRPATIVILLPTPAGVLAVHIAILAGVHIVVLALRYETAVPICSAVTRTTGAFRGSKACSSPLRVGSMCGLCPLIAAYRDGTPPVAVSVRTLTRCTVHTGIRVVGTRRGRAAIGTIG